MNTKTLDTVKKSGILFAGFLILYFLFWLVIHIGLLFEYRSFTTAIQTTARQHPLFSSNQALSVIQKPTPLYEVHGQALQFSAKYGNNDVDFILVPLMGRYGPYIGIFAASKNSYATFCGLINLPKQQKKIAYYGISSETVTYYLKKISSIYHVGGA